MQRLSRLAAWLAAGAVMVLLVIAGASQPAQARPVGAGLLSHVTLQGRADHSGTGIYVDNAIGPSMTTGADGLVALALDPGVHVVVARHLGYVSARKQVTIQGGVLTMPDVMLRAGDTNGDDRVNLFDLTRLGSGYLTSPPQPPGADLNGDGVVNLLDLVLLGSNYNLTGPQEWYYELTPTPSVTPPNAPTATVTLTRTPLPTRTPAPFQPHGLCILPFGDTNHNGVQDAGETALAGRTVRIYDTQSPLTPPNALASYTFTGTETTPHCFGTVGLENGTYRIQFDAAPAGGWGLIYSDPVAPVRALVSQSNVWEVEVDAGKSVFFSAAGGTPQPTPTLTALNVCGTLSVYVPAKSNQEGTLTFFGEPSYTLAPGAVIGNSGTMIVGSSGCVAATLTGEGYITGGTWAAATPTPTP